MFRSGFHLSTVDHLHAAQYNRTPIEVWQQGKIIDYGGQIERVTEDAVWINGGRYLIAVCEFKIR